ncbi:MAG: hypothetical protein RL030_1809 [Pseudomonadota bacterium]|jgi:hypothetical protein
MNANDLRRTLLDAGQDKALVNALCQEFTPRLWAAPLAFLSTNSPSNVLAASGGLQSLSVQNPDTSGYALITHIGIVSDGPFLIQLTPTDLGAGLFVAPISSETLWSYLDTPGRFPQSILLRGSDSLRADLTNDFGAVANNVRLTFHGYRLLPKNRV